MQYYRLYIISLLLILSCPLFAPNTAIGYDYDSIQAELTKQYQIKCILEYRQELENFKLALAQRESDNNWKQYNPYGYIGKFQFGQSALKATGYGHIKFLDFMDNPSIFPEADQEKAMDSLLRFNEFLLRDYIGTYLGEEFLDSIKITRSGLLAASHLAGTNNVKRFLTTNGKYNPSDHLGTRLSDYLFTFGEQFH
ncbi:MAG: transglycosylase family protein [Bacteroidales bacterium]|nr:transglycosylase family protein [Bacteroidales bacterium]